MFLMISGSLFLSREIPVKKLYGKYILRIFTVFLSWSSVYALAVYTETKDASQIIPNIITGHYHMWFLPMIAAFYMAVPLLKKITASDFLTKYFLVLSLIFAFILPQFVSTISAFSEQYGEAIEKLSNSFHMDIAATFTGYFVFGLFMSRAVISKKAEKVIYALGILGFVLTVSASDYVNSDIRILLEISAIFVLLREHCPKNERLREVFRIIGKYSLGVYLAHEAVIQVLRKLGLDTISFNPVLSVPVISVTAFAISLAISAILNHIPVVKKYIV